MKKFAIEALRHAAMDYLLKPLDEQELKTALDRIETKTNEEDITDKLDVLFKNLNNEHQIKLNTSTGFVIINVNEIMYYEGFKELL